MSAANPLRALRGFGQSVWLDDIRRGWLADGTLARLVAEDGIAGVTSNPAIFEKAMGKGGEDYGEAIDRLLAEGRAPLAIYEALAVEDVGGAADVLRATWDREGGADGFASLEVSPHLADDTAGTVEEARRLWKALGRPNAMIKVPGTTAGLPAIRALVADGINVNVTLLFGVARYREVVECFLEGLEQRLADGKAIDGVASVASLFLSRIDTHVDGQLDRLREPSAREVRGRAAIASARLAYAIYEDWVDSGRWRGLAARGARPQRLLWASTSSKDPAYEDTRYVDALVGPQTVTTLPMATLEAYRDHGRPAPRLAGGREEAMAVRAALGDLGIDLERVAQALERDGVRKFVEPFDRLQAALAARGTSGA